MLRVKPYRMDGVIDPKISLAGTPTAEDRLLYHFRTIQNPK